MPQPNGSNNADDLAISLDTEAMGDGADAGQTIDDPIGDQFNNSVFGQPNVKDGVLEGLTQSQDGQGGQSDEDAGATDPKRWAYWQSQADKREKKAAALEQELNLYRPLIDLMENDEEVMAVIERKSKAMGAKPAEAALVAPKPPEVPSGYNETDALTNPASESFKYRKAYEKYMQDKLQYMEQKIELNNSQMEKRYASEQQRIEAEQRSRQVANYLASKHGFTPAQQSEFISMMADPNSLHIDNLVAYYNFRKRTARAPGGMPPPPAGGGGTKGAMTPDQEFNAMLYAGAKKQYTP